MERTTTPRGDEYFLVTESSDLQEVANSILRSKVFGLDIETTSLHPRDGKIRLIQVSDGKTIYVVDCFRTNGPGPIPAAIEQTDAICVVHNLKFEQKWFKHHHCIDIWPAFCTFRASAILYNGRNFANDLYTLYARELDTYPGTDDLGGGGWEGHVSKAQYDYAADDVTRLHALREVLRKKLSDWGLLQTALVEFGVALPEGEVELNGIHLDTDAWMEVYEANLAGAERLRQKLLTELPNPTNQLLLPGIEPPTKSTRTTKNVFNLDSPDQMVKSLQMMGLERTIETQDGKKKQIPIDSTAEILLAQYAAKHPIIKDLFKYREYSKNASSFGEKYLKHIHPQTGRIHAEYWPFTGAGRYACAKPNLQQIPRDPRFRSCFRAMPGWVFVAADYAGIEMRIAAEVARAGNLANVFRTGKDAHTNTAALINSLSYEEVAAGVAIEKKGKKGGKYSQMRQEAKAVNFGLLYGMGAKKLVLYAMANYGVTLTQKQATGFRNKFFEAYPGLKKWHNLAYRDGQREGITRTLNGRLRYLDTSKAYSEYFNCLDAETEALTNRGWVRGLDLQKSDVLLTKNADTGALEWQKMTDLKRWPDYEGPLVEFRSRSFNAVSTPNHRWLVYNKASRKDECKTTAAISRHGDHRIHRTGNYNPEGPSVFSDDFVELCGWFITDGTWYLTGRNKDRPESRIMQSQRANLPKVRRIDALISRMGIGNGRYVTEETQQVQWRLCRSMTDQLHEIFPSRRLDPSFLLRLTRSQLDLLLEVMLLGDGTCDGFCSGDRVQAGAFQMLCTLTGFSSSCAERDMSKYEPKSDKFKNIPKGTVVHIVNIHVRDKTQIQQEQVREFSSRQPVWCPVVPNTFFVARREGQVFVTGNSPVQGTGADALKKSMRNVLYRLRNSVGDSAKIIHHVHDEIIIEAKDDPDVIAEVKVQVEKGMTEAMETMVKNVPVAVDAAHGPSWAEVH